MRSYNVLYLLWDLKTYGNMWPESFGGFTFDLGPLLQALLWSLIYNAYGTLKLLLEVFDVNTYVKQHCINILMGHI